MALRGAGALVSVIVVVLPILGFMLVDRLQQGPISLQELAPWLQASIQDRLDRPISIHHLQLALSDDRLGGIVLRGGPVRVEGDRPLQIEALALRVGLPFRLREVELRAGTTDAKVLLAAWPRWFLPDLHARLSDLVQGGVIAKGYMRYRFAPGADDLQMQLAAENVLVQLPNGLPVVSAAKGDIVVAGDRLHVRAPEVAGAGLAAQAVDVVIEHFAQDIPERLHLQGKVGGNAEALYRLFTTEPLALLPRDLIDVASLRGAFDGDLTLGLPLNQDPDANLIDLAVAGRFSGLSAKVVEPRRVDLSKADGRFSVSDGAIRVDGDATMFGARIAVKLRDRWRGKNDGRRIELRGQVDAGLIERLGGRLPDVVAGSAGVTAKLHQAKPSLWRAEIDADLGNASIDEPLSGFKKPAGSPGRLAASGQVAADGAWAVDQFALRAGTQEATGSLRRVEHGLQLQLDRLSTPVSDLGARITLGDDGAVSGKIAGAQARLPLAALDSSAPVRETQPQPPYPLDLNLSIDQVATSARPISTLRGKLSRDASGFRDLHLTFNLDGPASVDIMPVPAGQGRRLELRAANAGALMAALGAGQGIERGQLKVDANLKQQEPAIVGNGRIDIKEAALQAGDPKPVSFQKIVIPFQIDGPKVTLDAARLTGPTIGIRISGTLNRQSGALAMSGEVTPLYPLNRVIGQIPIIGHILGGSKGLGAINAEFTLTGTMKDPKAKLRTGSILVPGVIRDLLAALSPH